MLKLTICLVSFSIWIFPVWSQTTITNAILPQVGDSIEYAIDDQPTALFMDAAGSAQFWDLRSLSARQYFKELYKAPNLGLGAENFPTAQVFGALGQDLEAFYRFQDSEWQLLGLYGQDPIGLGLNLAMEYRPPLVEHHVPLHFLDDFESQSDLAFAFAAADLPDSIRNLLPIQPDSIRFTLALTRKDLVDAWGTLALPAAEFEVLRLKRLNIQEAKLEAKVAFLGWQDVSPLVSNYLPQARLGQDTSLSYHFFNNMTKQAIATCLMDKTGEQVLSARFQYSPITDTNVPEFPVFSTIDLYPNPVQQSLHVNFNNIPSGSYQLRIFNLLGVLVLQEQVVPTDTGDAIKINLAQAGLSQGTYLVQLVGQANRVFYAETIMFTP